jgi:hypothetical protein
LSDLCKYTVFLVLVALFLLPDAAVSMEIQDPNDISAPIVSTDHSPVTVRLPDEASLDRFRRNPEFRYTRDVQYPTTFWEHVKYYLQKWLRSVFDSDVSGKWTKRILIILLVVAAVFVLLKMLKIDTSGIFFSSPETIDLSDKTIDQDIRTAQLDKMLEKALDQQQYRLAVRLTYLIMLKLLSDAGQIHWQPDKTNRSYLGEINREKLRNPFAELTRQYEYVWYGDFDITEKHYADVADNYHQLKGLLS